MNAAAGKNTPHADRFDNNNNNEEEDSRPNQQQHSSSQDTQQINTENTVIVEYDLDSPISPLDENEPIDFSLVYALHTFVANLEGQVCVLKGDPLELLDDSNSYWWLVKCLKTEEVIPESNITWNSSSHLTSQRFFLDWIYPR
jgi:hypothetical protein